MIYLVASVSFFALFLLTHIFLHRLKVMKFQPPAFLLLSLVWLVIYVFLLQKTSAFSSWIGSNPKNLWAAPLVFTSMVLYLLLCLAYVAESTVIENESPSMRIVKLIQNRPSRKISFQELKEKFSDQEFVVDRLNDLVTHGHVIFDGSHYSLSPRGSLIAGAIRAYRQSIRRGLGG